MDNLKVTSDFGEDESLKKDRKKNKRTEILVICFGIFFSVFIVIPALFGAGEDTDKTNISESNAVETKVEENAKKTNAGKKKQEKKSDEESSKRKESEKEEKQISKKEYIKKCKEYGYKKVLRNPEKYIGKKVKVKLKISQVHEEGLFNSTKYYFAYSKTDYGTWYGNEYAIMDERESEKPKLLEDDIIEVYGEIAEPEETVSLIISSSELFSINMRYVKLIKG